MNARLGLLAFALGLGLASCRDAPELFTAADRIERPLSFPLRLTYNVNDDRTPSWSPGSDSVYYAAEHAEGPSANFLSQTSSMLGIRVGHGTASALIPAIDRANVRRYAISPVLAPSRDRLAYVELRQVYMPAIKQDGTLVCGTGPPAATTNPHIGPRLGEIALHIRSLDITGTHSFLSVPLVGRQLTYDAEARTVWVVRYVPFQRLYDEVEAFPFRPSWAPSADRLAFSDGVRVLITSATDLDTALVLPAHGDAVSPAFSPDGLRIAFTELQRTDSASVACTYLGPFGPIARQIRTVYNVGARTLVVSAPDGSGRIELGAGEEPAWSPDGTAVYARRADAIWRVPVDGSAATRIAGTDGGREPSVSPDGRYLAFTRRFPRGDYDVWVVSLES